MLVKSLSIKCQSMLSFDHTLGVEGEEKGILMPFDLIIFLCFLNETFGFGIAWYYNVLL